MDALGITSTAAPAEVEPLAALGDALARAIGSRPSAEGVDWYRTKAATTSVLDIAEQAMDNGLINEGELHGLFSKYLALPRIEAILPEQVDEQFLAEVPIAFARRHGVLGLSTRGDALTLALSRLDQALVGDHVATLLRRPLIVALAPTEQIMSAINLAYGRRSSDFNALLTGMAGDGVLSIEQADLDERDLLDTSTRAPVIKLVNLVLFEAVKRRASDVHFQPFADHLQVRYRIDGVLYDFLSLPSQLLDEVASRVKVIGGMDIAEKRIAQDGRAAVAVGDRSIDLRISIIPTRLGERVVLRLLDKSTRLYELGELGMSERDRTEFEKLLGRTHGIILVTGPTGSGKSTTLYAALHHLDSTEKNILTLEDPIEYELVGISQTQVSTKKGMNFATGLRAVLRQDPDIIMIGEIRDEETARMAVQSSMTGHLVLSTLHTNDAAGAVTRLLDLGIEPYLVASSLVAVLALRLVRIPCPACSRPRQLLRKELESLGLDGSTLPQVPTAVGCEGCSGTGYHGRCGIFELLIVDETIRSLVTARAKSSEIKDAARRNHMRTLRDDALSKLLAGRTTAEEVGRTTFADDGVEAES